MTSGIVAPLDAFLRVSLRSANAACPSSDNLDSPSLWRPLFRGKLNSLDSVFDAFPSCCSAQTTYGDPTGISERSTPPASPILAEDSEDGGFRFAPLSITVNINRTATASTVSPPTSLLNRIPDAIAPTKLFPVATLPITLTRSTPQPAFFRSLVASACLTLLFSPIPLLAVSDEGYSRGACDGP